MGMSIQQPHVTQSGSTQALDANLKIATAEEAQQAETTETLQDTQAKGNPLAAAFKKTEQKDISKLNISAKEKVKEEQKGSALKAPEGLGEKTAGDFAESEDDPSLTSKKTKDDPSFSKASLTQLFKEFEGCTTPEALKTLVQIRCPNDPKRALEFLEKCLQNWRNTPDLPKNVMEHINERTKLVNVVLNTIRTEKTSSELEKAGFTTTHEKEIDLAEKAGELPAQLGLGYVGTAESSRQKAIEKYDRLVKEGKTPPSKRSTEFWPQARLVIINENKNIGKMLKNNELTAKERTGLGIEQKNQAISGVINQIHARLTDHVINEISNEVMSST